MLSWLTGGAFTTAIGSIEKGLSAREKTKQVIALARSLWRPEIARMLGMAIAMLSLGVLVIALTHLTGLVINAEFAMRSSGTAPIDALWDRYLDAFLAILAAGGGFLGVTSHGRSKYDKRWQAAANGADVPPPTGGFGSVFRRGPAVPDVVSEPARVPQRFEPLDQGDTLVKTRPGVRVDRPAKAPPAILLPTEDWRWSETSIRRLRRAHPALQRLFEWLLHRSPYDLSIGETTRSAAKQAKYVEGGHSLTMDSRHLERPAMAVDFYILDPDTGRRSLGKRPREVALYVEVLGIAKQGAAELGIQITSGGLNWGWDYFHIELHRDYYPRLHSVLDDVNFKQKPDAGLS